MQCVRNDSFCRCSDRLCIHCLYLQLFPLQCLILHIFSFFSVSAILHIAWIWHADVNWIISFINFLKMSCQGGCTGQFIIIIIIIIVVVVVPAIYPFQKVKCRPHILVQLRIPLLNTSRPMIPIHRWKDTRWNLVSSFEEVWVYVKQDYAVCIPGDPRDVLLYSSSPSDRRFWFRLLGAQIHPEFKISIIDRTAA